MLKPTKMNNINDEFSWLIFLLNLTFISLLLIFIISSILPRNYYKTCAEDFCDVLEYKDWKFKMFQCSNKSIHKSTYEFYEKECQEWDKWGDCIKKGEKELMCYYD